MRYLILIILFIAVHSMHVSGQDSAVNRRKVIGMILSQSQVKVNDGKTRSSGIYTIAPQVEQPGSPGFRSAGAAIPRYCLAKGAVICRLEEYVQLHSPFRLNIGVGGE